LTGLISSDLILGMDNEKIKTKSVAFKVTLPADMYKDFEVMRGSTSNSQLVMDLYRYAVHMGFNPNNINTKDANDGNSNW
jgi:hypothetical protein